MTTSLTWKQSRALSSASLALFLMTGFGIWWSLWMMHSWTTPVTVALGVIFIVHDDVRHLRLPGRPPNHSNHIDSTYLPEYAEAYSTYFTKYVDSTKIEP